MSWNPPVDHFVCTKDEAREITGKHDRFWISTCWCRAERGRCARSDMEVCLSFREDSPANPSGMKEVSRDKVMALIENAREWGLVSRMFARKGGDGEVEGICFCCDDCCSFFTERTGDKPARGAFIESTIEGCCSSCGMCERACRFEARVMDEGELVVLRYKCYGCGVCAETCPTNCIEMLPRAPERSGAPRNAADP
jgi:ferredoxin